MPDNYKQKSASFWLINDASTWLVALVLIGAFWFHTFNLIDEDRARTIALTENDLINLGRVSQEHAERTFSSADQTLRTFIAEYLEHDGKLDLKALTDQGLVDTQIILQLAVLDAQGFLELSNLPFSGRIDLSDREHFKTHLTANSNQLFISSPVLGRASGKWSIQLSRRITGKNGEFRGVVVASVDPDYFSNFYSQLNLGHQAVTTLIGMDGIIRIRKTVNNIEYGGDVSASPTFLRLAQGEMIGTLTYPSISDKIERTYHFRKLPSYPLVISLGIGTTEIFAEHEKTKSNLRRQAVIISILLAALLLITSRSNRVRRSHLLEQKNTLAKLHTLTNRAPGVIYQYLLRPDGSSCFPFASAGMLETHRLNPEDVRDDAQAILDLTHPDDLEAVSASIIASAKTLTPWLHEYRVCFEDGTIRWLSGKATPEKLDDGSILWHGFISDITRRKQEEASLITLSAAVEQSPVSTIITDASGNIIYVNPMFEQVTGYRRAEVIGKNPRILSSGEKSAEDYREMWTTLIAGKVWSGEFHNRRKDGSLFWEKATISPIFDDLGKPIHYLALKENVTGHKRAEEALRIAATAFESQEGMFITDAAGIILRVNRAFSKITGYSAEDAIGQTPGLLSSGRHDAAFYNEMREAIEQSGAWQGEIWNRRKNGEVFPEWLTITAVKNDAGQVTHHVSTLTDITQRKAAEDQIKHLAFYDPLTRLPNRRLLLDRMQQAMAASTRSGCEGALLFIDLDHFKNLNDTLGHDKGDMLLQQVGQRLQACVREGDTVARLGGDEFVLMLEDLSKIPREAAAQTEAIGEKILDTLNQPYDLAGHEYHNTPSIGVTLFADHKTQVDELMKRADLAMYQAKAAGRNTLRFFDPDMQAEVNTRVALERDLRCCLQQNQLRLYYQAQVNGDGLLTGVEALVRWQHPERGLVSPAEFIPLAEESGLILQLGHWVLETACRQLASWAASTKTSELTIAVNVSARQFRQPDFVSQILALLENSGANPQRLKLELTESLLLDDVESIILKMSELKARGVGFSLDDFGTGYSSLSYLKRLPLDQLKIDQSFVRDLLTDPNDAAIAHTIVALAQALGMSVIAEGVETEAQRFFLAGLGCHAYQGYFFGRPVALAEFERTQLH